MIDGVVVQPLKQIADERGKVMHMIRCDSPVFTKFGEIYFSQTNHGVVKAWKKHLHMTQNFAVPIGNIRLVIFDGRQGSRTFGEVQVLELGEKNYNLIKIPPLVWYGFCGLSDTPALIANCTDIPHDPKETEKVDHNDPKVPYVWGRII